MSRTLAEIWNKLAAMPDNKDGIRRLRIAPKAFKVYAGWSVAIRQPALVVEILASAMPDDIEFPQSVGFIVSQDVVKDGKSVFVRISVEAQGNQFSDLFPVLIEDVCRYIISASSEEQLVRLTLSRLHHWQVFLKRHRHARLSEPAQIGLWGELHFLSSRLMHHLGVEASIESWQGPESRNQDFEFKKVAVEVKTTAANPHEKLHIASVLQLEPEGLDILFLYHIALVAHRESGKSLPALIHEIRENLHQSAHGLELFNERLFTLGYLDSESSWYEKTGYAVLSQTAYKVEADFPRIHIKDVPKGVGDVKYSIVLSSCTEFLMKNDPFESGATTNE